MSNTNNLSPTPSDTKISQLILKIVGIAVAVGILGGAMRDAYNNWAWTKEVYDYWVPETSSPKENIPTEARKVAEQKMSNAIDSFLAKTEEQMP